MSRSCAPVTLLRPHPCNLCIKNEELQHYRNKIVHLYDLICDKFPDRKHFDVIWQWVKYTLYEKLGLRK